MGNIGNTQFLAALLGLLVNLQINVAGATGLHSQQAAVIEPGGIIAETTYVKPLVRREHKAVATLAPQPIRHENHPTIATIALASLPSWNTSSIATDSQPDIVFSHHRNVQTSILQQCIQNFGWFCLMIGSYLVFAFAVFHGSQVLTVDFLEDSSDSKNNVASWYKTFWPWVLASLAFLVTASVWLITIALVTRVDRKSAALAGTSPQQGLQRAGERAFIAGACIAASVGVTSLWVLVWRWKDQTPITTERMALAAMHGAISIVPAALLEACGFGLPKGHLVTLGQIMQFASMAVFAGICEEGMKALAASCGAMGPGCPWGTSALEVRRAFALVGLTSGCGFMVTENALYLIQVAVDPAINALGFRQLLLLTAGARVLFNLHPWLTGAACARLAAAAPAGTWPTSAWTWAWALWPSVALHVAYDLLLVTNGPAALLPAAAAPLIFCPIAFVCFQQSWAALGTGTSKPAGFSDSISICD